MRTIADTIFCIFFRRQSRLPDVVAGRLPPDLFPHPLETPRMSYPAVDASAGVACRFVLFLTLLAVVQPSEAVVWTQLSVELVETVRSLSATLGPDTMDSTRRLGHPLAVQAALLHVFGDYIVRKSSPRSASRYWA